MALGKPLTAVVLWLSTLNIAEGTVGISFEYNSSGFTGGVNTKSGPIRGKEVTVLGEVVEVYLGIPFAQPPIGDLRFKNALPVEPWKDTLLATQVPNSCRQELVYPSYFDEWNTKAPLSEDCLFLNIWVPKKLRSAGNATVLVWIHGGGYFTGASTLEQYDGAHLAAKNGVIVASMNYRIGALGFMYLGTRDAPGNMGLFDQHLAIKWIKENVEFFGGNANSLTIFGESAGSGSTSFHLLSPTSKNLTKRFIMQSGTANTPWSFKTSQEARESALQLASVLNCLSNDTETVIKCLRTLPAERITSEQDKLIKLGMVFPFVPTVDGEFLPKSPEELIEDGEFEDIEAIIGTTKDEGTMFAAYEQPQYFNEHLILPQLTNAEHASILKTTLSNIRLLSIEEEIIIHQYTDWEHYGDENINAKNVIHLFGDYFFICPATYFAQKIKEKGAKVFFYSFNHEKSVRQLGAWMGASHTDDIEFVFGAPLVSTKNYTESERALSLGIMSYFTTFAKTGKPSLNETEWPEYSKQSQEFMVLHANGNRLLLNGPRANVCAFWNDLMPKIKRTFEEATEKKCVSPEGSEVKRQNEKHNQQQKLSTREND